MKEPLIAPQLKLTDNNQEILTINDFNQVAETNSAGLTGLFWIRSVYENFVTRPVNDLWFAILNDDGTKKLDPQKLTSNSIPADQAGGNLMKIPALQLFLMTDLY